MEYEWLHEPNHMEFHYKGYFCEIHRHELGHLCGYVYIPVFQGPMTQKVMAYLIDHPLTDGFDYTNFEEYFDLHVHGGVTHGDIIEEEKGALIKIGFDCAHSGDLIPGMKTTLGQIRWGEGSMDHLFRDVYRNIAYVEKEIKEMVDAITEGEDLHGEE